MPNSILQNGGYSVLHLSSSYMSSELISTQRNMRERNWLKSTLSLSTFTCFASHTPIPLRSTFTFAACCLSTASLSLLAAAKSLFRVAQFKAVFHCQNRTRSRSVKIENKMCPAFGSDREQLHDADHMMLKTPCVCAIGEQFLPLQGSTFTPAK